MAAPKTNLRPLEDRVVVKEIAPDITTPGGLVLPPTVTNAEPMLCEVIAVGPGRIDSSSGGWDYLPMGVHVGDRVILPRYAGTQYKADDGAELLITRACEILAVVGKAQA